MRDALGAVKVGHTYDLPKRLHSVRLSVAHERRPVMLVRAVEVPKYSMHRLEVAVHKRLAACLLPGEWEWFDTVPAVASRFLNDALWKMDPWDDLAKAKAIWRNVKDYPEWKDAAKALKAEVPQFTTARAFKLWGGRT